ncbi:MAG TPA: Hsp20/alpha crystallin family protein [Candidatus Baltobacteraceae bacterium]|nr:Hsp20/alpha crystallin family protein [Candidatus Baltobacteraceae bacterium]
MDLVILRSRAVWEPNADVVIDDQARSLVVRVELAGADSDSLRVFVDERHLFISGRRAEGARLRTGSFLQKEIADGEFVKKISLPVSVQYGEVTATYADGMLTIALPIAAMEYIPATRTELRMIVKRILS